VRDARVPLCSRCGRLEELIQKKRRIVVMNKSDLIGPADVERWVRHFAQQGQAVAFTNAAKGSRIRDLMPQELLKRGLITRADRMLLFMIIGIPNTGKSSMINALRRQGMRARQQAGGNTNVAETGARPGVTRHVSTVQFCSEPPVRSANFKSGSAHHCWCNGRQWSALMMCQGSALTINRKLLHPAHQAFLIDTPGIMHTALSPEDGLKLALTGAIKENIVDPLTLADYLLFLLNDRGQVCTPWSAPAGRCWLPEYYLIRTVVP
jgi:ribosome biogenesis GTPase A